MDRQTIETLIKIKKLQILEKNKHDLEIALKIILNSLYGAISSNYFIFFNLQMARSITLTGQLFNKYMEKTLNRVTNELLGNDADNQKDYVLTMDTDSLKFDQLIKTSKGDIAIGEFYNKYAGEVIRQSDNNFTNRLSENIDALTYSKDDKLCYRKIKYIKKHLVKKRMFKIKVGNDEVTITADHSLMIKRNGELIKIKPTEIQKGDKLVHIV